MDIDLEGFEVVKRKGRCGQVEELKPNGLALEDSKPECLILSEEELKSQGNRMNWRKGNTDSAADLFRVQHDRQEFPKAFQNYRPTSEIKKETPFTYMKQKQIKIPKEVDTPIDSLDFGTLLEPELEPELEPDRPYATVTPQDSIIL